MQRIVDNEYYRLLRAASDVASKAFKAPSLYGEDARRALKRVVTWLHHREPKRERHQVAVEVILTLACAMSGEGVPTEPRNEELAKRSMYIANELKRILEE